MALVKQLTLEFRKPAGLGLLFRYSRTCESTLVKDSKVKARHTGRKLRSQCVSAVHRI